MKIFVVDTNVFIRAGKHVLTGFDDNEVVIPFVVIQELEKLRSKNDSVGKYARSVLHEIERIAQSGDIHKGVVMENGGTVRVELNHVSPALPTTAFPEGNRPSNDIRILTVAHNLMTENDDENTGRKVVLITDDIPLRIYSQIASDKAVNAQPYRGKTTRFSGLETVEVSNEFLCQVIQSKQPVEAPASVLRASQGASHCFIQLEPEGGGKPLLCSLTGTRLEKYSKKSPLGNIRTHNSEQTIALSYLLNKDIPIVSISGTAGAGKTMLSVASGLEQVHKGEYDNVLVYRPMYAVGGQEVGFLPGDMKEKLSPWENAVYDSVSGIVDGAILQRAREQKSISVESITYIRGRTLKNTFVIVDEAQNLSEVLLLELQSRIGSGSKIVFLWDSTQRDNPNVGYNDGPVSLADKLKESPLFAHIALGKSQRSQVADLAGKHLQEHFG